MKSLFDYTILCHLFYDDGNIETINHLQHLSSLSSFFIFNISANNKNKELHTILHKKFPGCVTVSFPNKGRDIGAKIRMIELLKQLDISSKYTLIIHDKQSPHLSNGKDWRNELFKVAGIKKINLVTQIFDTNEDVGIICSAKFIQNDYDEKSKAFLCTCNEKIKELLLKLNLNTHGNYDYVAGNIFWIRTNIIVNFIEESIKNYNIMSSLEDGNITDFENGSYVHAWERILSWIIFPKKLRVYGI